MHGHTLLVGGQGQDPVGEEHRHHHLHRQEQHLKGVLNAHRDTSPATNDYCIRVVETFTDFK